MLRTAIYSTYSKFGICTVHQSFIVHSPVLLMVLFYCLSLTQLDTLPLYIAHSTFFRLSPHNTLNRFWNSSAFKTRPRTQYCETISTVNEKVNVTYKMNINLMPLHFNGTLTQRRIKLLPRDQPNHLAPWWNRLSLSQQMQSLTCRKLLPHMNCSPTVCLRNHTSKHLHTLTQVTLMSFSVPSRFS